MAVELFNFVGTNEIEFVLYKRLLFISFSTILMARNKKFYKRGIKVSFFSSPSIKC